MHEIQLRDAKATLSAVIDNARQGEPSIITRHGRREAVGFVISHLLDPVPTEIHVFTAIASGKAVFVSTKSGMAWNVEPSGGTARIQGIDLGEKEGN